KVYIPIAELGIKDDETYELFNLLTDEWLFCKGQETTVTLDPFLLVIVTSALLLNSLQNLACL
ncbi:hypothetical protein MBAV_005204, partial [Candidatus Magnetobacterium bavaricum]